MAGKLLAPRREQECHGADGRSHRAHEQVLTMATPATVRFQAGDIWDTPDDGKRYEVIDGRRYVTPPPAAKHQGASGVLFGYLWSWIWPRRAGRLYAAPIAVVLDDENALQLSRAMAMMP
jgi:hypothetical protein